MPFLKFQVKKKRIHSQAFKFSFKQLDIII